MQSERGPCGPLCHLGPILTRPRMGPPSGEIMSDDKLLLLQRRLDEVERKLERMMEELRIPTAIGYFPARRAYRPIGCLKAQTKQIFGVIEQILGPALCD